MKKPARQRDLSALIDSYQQAYWQASSLAARNGIALKLWTLRREAQAHQHLQQHGIGLKQKTQARPLLRARLAAIIKSSIVNKPPLLET